MEKENKGKLTSREREIIRRKKIVKELRIMFDSELLYRFANRVIKISRHSGIKRLEFEHVMSDFELMSIMREITVRMCDEETATQARFAEYHKREQELLSLDEAK